jgi:RND family efflux transporter MFP subunit
VKLSILKKPRLLAALAAAVVIVVAAAAASRWTRSVPDVPTAEVRRGEFVDYIAVRGEIEARKSITITAPVGVGGDLQIVKLSKNGSMVKKDEIVCQFDTTSLQRQLDQRTTELRAAEAEISRGRAQARMQDEENATELLNAQFNVERGKLDVSKQEILSEIEGEKTKLVLNNYEARLAETEQRVKSGKISNNADIESRKQRRDKALFDVRLAQSQMDSLTLRAPSDGIITLLQNYRSGGFGRGGAPEFKEGDRAWSGAAIAQLPDLSAIRVSARVDESDRGRLKLGQEVLIRIDAVPEKEFSGKIEEISPLAKLDFSGWPVTKNFDVTIQVGNSDPRIRPGMSAGTRIILDRVPDSTLVPSTAVFQKNGRAVVYVLHGRTFEERPVQIARRSTVDMLVRAGLQPGERVALKDPTVSQEQAR